MKEIKQEELQEFWEWCGIRYEADQDCFKVIFPDGEWYNFGQDWKMGKIEPPLDLNNLLKYAVPKLDIVSIILYPATKDRWGCYFGGKYQNYNIAKTPTQALYQAIQKARKVK